MLQLEWVRFLDMAEDGGFDGMLDGMDVFE